MIEGDGFRLRRARPEDAAFLVELLAHEEVRPYLAAVRASTADEVLELIGRSEEEPEAFGLFVIEVDGRAAGTFEFQRSNQRSRIARLGGLAVHPDFRGRGIADKAARLFQRHLLFDLGFHRLELEVYGFNERAMRHAERTGFVREGVKRKAYRRDGEWVDGVLFALIAEDLETRSESRTAEESGGAAGGITGPAARPMGTSRRSAQRQPSSIA